MQRNLRKMVLFFPLACLALALVGCGDSGPEPAATDDEISNYVKENPDIKPTPYLPDNQL
jgi:hypothetical protein